MARRLFRSTQNKMIGGVCGGLAEYFETDPSLIRIAAVALLFAGGVGLIAYIVGWIILPKADSMSQLSGASSPGSDKVKSSSTSEGNRFWSTYFPGLLLITIGTIFLLHEMFYWVDWDDIWPVILILVGAGIIIAGPWRNSMRDRQSDPMTSSSTTSGTTASADASKQGEPLS
jgi:phage shock protein PspC (stress-responsive transcriptional regulator)